MPLAHVCRCRLRILHQQFKIRNNSCNKISKLCKIRRFKPTKFKPCCEIGTASSELPLHTWILWGFGGKFLNVTLISATPKPKHWRKQNKGKFVLRLDFICEFSVFCCGRLTLRNKSYADVPVG